MCAKVMPRELQAGDIPMLVRELTQGDRRALSRLLTLAAGGNAHTTLASAIQDVTKSTAAVIALTGSGGVGKSSLLGALAAEFVERGERVGILACDPESPVTGGALLGDRCRIAGAPNSDQIFIRSLSTGSGQQGVAQNIELMLEVMKRFAFDRIFVETVGAGQGDIAVRRVADVVVLVLQPQTGDALQWEKAGILEVADVVVINKCDLPGADHTMAEVTQQLQVTGGTSVPVVKTSVALGEGFEELCNIVAAAPSSRDKYRIPGAETE
jgi:LAO/AO transport system ATPase